MKRTRVIAAVVATLVVAGGLTACSASSGSSSTDGSNGPVTITILEQKQTRIDDLKKLIPGFESAMKKQGKSIKVKLIEDVLTDDQFKTKITQQFISGQAPDIVDMGENMIPGFAAAGYLAPLGSYLDKWSGWDHYLPQFRKAMVRQDGKIYSLMHDTGVSNFFYRKDILTQSGISTAQPATWKDLIARLVEIKDKTGEPPLVVPAGSAWGGGTWTEGFQPILSGTDPKYYNVKSGKWDLKSPGWLATFNLYSELVTKGLLPVQDLENPNPWEPTKYDKFPAGKLQVSAQGTWGWKYDWGPQGQSPIADLYQKVDTWQYPALKSGDKPYGWSSLGFGYTIPEKSQRKDAAMLFAEYLTTGVPLAEQLQSAGAASPRDDLTNVKPFSEEPKLLQATKDLKTSVYVATGDGSDQISQAVASATELILSGKASGAEAYKSFVKNATDLLGPDLVK
ncbi:extracellular solute-binding protein [Glaciihabitans sp. UYNi722]|uniref:ABC transporter substrate-binding protein n=1 Tax=Glaciihabitans sp. UYNi722 TaxID=3156344 RepID=UPI003395F5FD